MTQPQPRESNTFRYFVAGVLCVAVVLGICFVWFNAQVDRQREEAAERLELCLQAQSMARAASAATQLSETCRQTIERYSSKSGAR